MKFTLLPSLLSFLTFISGFAQTTLEIDTFRISAKNFIVEAPTDWFSIKVANEIQADTSWNYIAKYISTGTNTVAQIAIQIVNNSNYTPTKKEEKKFKKECTVTTIDFSGFSGYSLKYTPQKLKNCKGCELVYQNMYSIPLNTCQTLQAAFVGQGSKENVYPLQIAFAQFFQRFLTNNSSTLKSFCIVDFTEPMTKDTFRVENYYLVSLLPSNFSNSHLLHGDGYMIQRNDLCSRLFTINVTAKVIRHVDIPTPTESEIIYDTNVTIFPSSVIHNSQQKPIVTFFTTRTITTHDANKIVLTISCVLQDDEIVLQSYVIQMLREYSNALAKANPIARDSTPIIFKIPTVNPRPENDIRQPVKFEKTMPAAKPK